MTQAVVYMTFFTSVVSFKLGENILPLLGRWTEKSARLLLYQSPLDSIGTGISEMAFLNWSGFELFCWLQDLLLSQILFITYSAGDKGNQTDSCKGVNFVTFWWYRRTNGHYSWFLAAMIFIMANLSRPLLWYGIHALWIACCEWISCLDISSH